MKKVQSGAGATDLGTIEGREGDPLPYDRTYPLTPSGILASVPDVSYDDHKNKIRDIIWNSYMDTNPTLGEFPDWIDRAAGHVMSHLGMVG